jgi:hypothetical protein
MDTHSSATVMAQFGRDDVCRGFIIILGRIVSAMGIDLQRHNSELKMIRWNKTSYRVVPVDIRTRINSRLAGFALAFCESLSFVIPIPQISNDSLR